MAGSRGAELAAAVCEAGGLGSLPCAMLSVEDVSAGVAAIREVTDRPMNLNFFCHTPNLVDTEREARWRKLLEPYYQEYGIEYEEPDHGGGRRPFDSDMCGLVEEIRPAVVSFNFGRPAVDLQDRVVSSDCKVISSATTVAEACWLETRGVDAIIAQGVEAGGYRGMFRNDDIASLVGTFALVPRVVDAVSVTIIAAGGIGDGRGVAAAFMPRASAVQLGSVYLKCPESRTTPQHHQALSSASESDTALTNLFSGRPARGIVDRLMRELGPINSAAPECPHAAKAIAPIRAAASTRSRGDFSHCGQVRPPPSAMMFPQGNSHSTWPLEHLH